jgi:predicted Zn-dependent protease
VSPVDRAAALVVAAKVAGARACEALVTHTESARTQLRGRVSHSVSWGGTLRVWTAPGEMRVARGDRLEDLVDRAFAAEPAADPFDGPIATGASVPQAGLLIEDRRWGSLNDDGRAGLLREIAASTCAVDATVDLASGELYDERTVRAFASSRGVRLAEGATRFRLELELRAYAQGRTLTLRPGLCHRSLATIASIPVGTHAARRFSDLRVAADGVPPSPAVLLPGATAAIATALGPLFLDPALGSGFLARSSLDPRVILIDDGSIPGGYATRSFDDRGVPPGPVTVVRDGRADRLLLSPEAARAAVRAEPGHDVDGRPAVSNLVWAAGVRQLNAILIERARPTCWIDGFQSLDVDLQTGLATGVAHVERMCANEPQGVWPSAVVRIPLATCLTRLIDLGADTDRIGSVDAPAIWVDGVEVVPS